MRKTALSSAIVVLAIAGFAVWANGPDGKALYESKCAMCHGKDGVAKAMAKGSSNFADPKFQEASSAEAIEKIIADGKGKMKGLKDKLKPEEIKAVAAHVKTLK